MATYQKRGKRSRAIVRRQGKTLTKMYASKREAQEWAIATEADIASGEHVGTRPLNEWTMGRAGRMIPWMPFSS
jgi:hypothetical protein